MIRKAEGAVRGSPGRVAFVKIGAFSHINESLLEALQREFPDCQFDVVDVWDSYLARDLANLYACFREYGRQILIGRKNLSACMLHTVYIFKKIQKSLARRLATEGYRFTFQTQSLFDASTLSVPHFVYTDHTHLVNLETPRFLPHDLYSPAWIEQESTIYARAALVFTMSSNISRSLVRQYSCDPSKVVCVYGGSNVKMVSDAVTDPGKYSRKNILFVGLDWERKGGPELLKAFQRVLAVYPEAQLTIVGCAPKIDLPNCTVVGRVPLADVARYYAGATAFCLPSRSEPFGIAFVEALANRLPIVATNIGAIPDFVVPGENGYLVEPYEVEVLASRLAELIGHPDKCRAFGHKGYALACDRYTWSQTGARIRENIENYELTHASQMALLHPRGA